MNAPDEKSGERCNPFRATTRPSDPPLSTVPARDDVPPASGFILGLIVFITTQILLVAQGHPNIFAGQLWDSDSYLWLERVRQLWAGAGWFDHVNPRIDPPTGFVQHWTRPMDAILLAGAWILTPALGFNAALYWWGSVTGPLFFIGAALAVIWAGRPLLPRSSLWLLPLVLACQPAITATFAVGRPDHQSLLTVLFILLLGSMLRMVAQPARAANGVLAGLIAALTLWVSVSVLPLLLCLVIGLSIAWIGGNARLARVTAVFSGILCLAVTAALFVEYGPKALIAHRLDTLSRAYLLPFSLMLLFWLGATALPAMSRGYRIAYLFSSGALAGAILWLLVPEFVTEPLGRTDPNYLAIHLHYIRELQPTITLAELANMIGQVPLAVMLLGITLPGSLYVIWRIFRGPTDERRLWTLPALALAAYLPLAVLQVRWANAADALSVIPYVGFVAVALDTVLTRIRDNLIRTLIRPVTVITACLWIFGPALLFDPSSVIAATAQRKSDCRLGPVAKVLADESDLGAHPLLVLAFLDYGPELLYRTPHSVLSSNSHRPQPGFTLTYRIMSESDPKMALALLRERGIGFVLICMGSVEGDIYRPTGEGPSLYQRLAAGSPPEGLRPVAIPQGRGGGFRLFKVAPGKD